MKVDCFLLRVKVGTKIISSKGDYIVKKVPTDALDRMKKGCTWLQFSPKAEEELPKLKKEEILHLLDLRKRQGFKNDVLMLESVLNNLKPLKTSPEKKK